jgi:spoIIIJ-associated protein
VERILELMGEKATIEVVDDTSAENVELNIKGDGSGLLIGRHGQTLDALEYVVNRILARKLKDAAAPVSIDTESYRARRRRQLHRMALAKGEQAKREHLAVALEPMPPRDRRIIHLALKDDPLVTTRSSGEGFMRSVEIMPVDERREGPKGHDRRRERSRETGRERERTPPGQQGGFKHGQKRIV